MVVILDLARTSIPMASIVADRVTMLATSSTKSSYFVGMRINRLWKVHKWWAGGGGHAADAARAGGRPGFGPSRASESWLG